MHHDNFSYNPAFCYKDSASWFKEFILLQDGVSPGELVKKEDSAFLKNRIIQVNPEKHEFVKKSFFSLHLLRPNGFNVKEREIINHGWIHGIIFLCFLLFAFSQYGYFRRMQQIFKAYFANRLFNQLSRDGGLLSERVSIFLFISFFLSFSVFIYKTFEFYYDVPANGIFSFVLYLKVLVGVTLYYFLKMGLYKSCGFIFRSAKETSDYILNIYIFGQVTGVVLLPLIVMITYINNEFIIYIGLTVIALSYVYRLFRGVTITISNVKISMYYIFLYLCTLEILPLLILIKVFQIFIV